MIDIREAMASVEKELAAEGVPPEVAARFCTLAEQFGPALQTGLQMAGSATKTAAVAIAQQLQARALERAARARELATADRHARLAGEALSVPVMRDGQIVGSVSAQLNLPRTFAMVLGSAQVSQGEIPFAIDAEGKLYAANAKQE